jgi:hypothetical protein
MLPSGGVQKHDAGESLPSKPEYWLTTSGPVEEDIEVIFTGTIAALRGAEDCVERLDGAG